tara:strand:+ start:787 stop:3558 length:2772 start_codon:yes stop_codon:yes gene_type:complete
MTSSFQNVVGTPRDQVPDISNTNYLNTEADMTESVNKQIDDNIRDTKQFFDQMVELEELAASKLDKRLDAIQNIVGNVGSILKQRRAKEAEEISESLTDSIIDTFGASQEEFNTARNEYQLSEAKAKGGIFFDDIDQQEKLELVQGIISEEELDGPIRKNNKFYLERVGALVDIINSNGTLDSTTNGEFIEQAQKALLSFVRTVAFNELEAGRDPTDSRFVRLFIKDVAPQLIKEIEVQRRGWSANLREKVLSDQEKILDNRIIESVKGANILTKEGVKSDTTFYADKGVIHQVAEERFNGDRAKATDYVYDRIGQLVKDGEILPMEAREIYQNLEYYDQNGNKYDNYEAYLETQTEGTAFAARVQGRINRLSKIITDVEKEAVNNQDAQNIIEANNFVNKNVIPIIQENKKRGIIGLEDSQIGGLINDFMQQPFYIPGQTEIPKLLLSGLKETHTGGSRDKNVITASKYADKHNTTDDLIDTIITDKEELQGDKTRFSRLDKRVSELMKADFREKFNGPDNKNVDLFEVAEGRGTQTYEQYRDTILDELENNYDKYVAKAKERKKLTDAGVSDVIALRRELKKNPELFKKPEAFKSEPVDKLFDFVDTGGDRHPELKQYYKALRIRVPDGKGGFRILSGTEAIYDRATTLGLYDPKTKLADPYAKILQDFRKENDMKTFPSEQKAFRNMRTGEQQDFAEYLTMLQEKRGGQNANQFEFNRNGNTSVRQNLNNIDGRQLVNLAKRGSDNFGMYNLSTDMILDLDRLGLIDYNKPFNEDAQSFAVISLMNMNANRKSNAIRGAITEDTKNFGELLKLTLEEIQVQNKTFPNLANNYFAQFQNLDKEVAKIIISEVEKERLARKGREGQERARRQKLRDEGKKKELRSGRIEREQVFGYGPGEIEPTTIEELKQVPAVKRALEGR